MLKKVFKGLLYLLVLLVLTIGILWFWPVNPVQVDDRLSSIQAYSDTLVSTQFDLEVLVEDIGPDKSLLEPFEKAAALAILQYPQLAKAKIEIVESKTSAPLESNFKWSTFFNSKSNRIYRIHINTAENTEFDPVLMHNLPFNAQVGILAHELGHIAYYHKRTAWEILAFGVKYFLDSDFRAQHEQSTDLMPVYQGMGWQIYDYAFYVRNSPASKPLYEEFGKEFVDKYYLTPDRILEVMQDHPLYSNQIP